MTDEIVIGGDAEDIPPGTYPATLTALAVKNSKKYDSDFRVWTFTLENGSRVEGTSSMFTNSKSKPGRWIAALLGRKPEVGEKVTDLLIGKRALVVVDIGADEYPHVLSVIAAPSQSPQDAPGREDEAGVASEPTALDF